MEFSDSGSYQKMEPIAAAKLGVCYYSVSSYQNVTDLSIKIGLLADIHHLKFRRQDIVYLYMFMFQQIHSGILTIV